MAQWGNSDDAANSVIWAVSQLNKTANTDNQTELFGNVTSDVYFTGAKVGQFGVDSGEAAAMAGTATHAGWVLRTEGSGGRAGRVTYETLVAMGSIGDSGTADASDDTQIPDYRIVVRTQPSDASANSDLDETATFTIAAYTVPAGGTITYDWHYSDDDGDTWTSANGESGFYGDTTEELTVEANTVADGTLVRTMLSVSGGATTNTSSATLTVESAA